MTCFHPIKAWKNNIAMLDIPPEEYYKSKKISFMKRTTWQEIEIPCGRCLGCKLDQANMWATRLYMETKCWKKCCFITLTYRPKDLPINENGLPTLVKKDIQDFMKRLRKKYKGNESWIHPIKEIEEQPIRYFCAGEYGENATKRPHYHLALFNFEPDDLKPYKISKKGHQSFTSKSLYELWGKGFVVVEELNFASACYIARYVQKKAGLEPVKREYTGEIREEIKIDERNGNEFIHDVMVQKTQEHERQPEFILMSRGVGIGRTYWDKNKDKIKRNGGIMVKLDNKVKTKPIPRYFKKLWESENYEEYYRFKYEQHKNMIRVKAEIISKINLPDGTSDIVKWEFYLANQEKILKKKAEKLRRNEFI